MMRWSQLGFGRTSSTSRSQETPRNLMGFKDGTANIRAEDTDAMRRYVWLGRGDGPAWMRGGSYMVTRRIRMLLEVWDRSALEDQQQTIGRPSTAAPRWARQRSPTRSTSTPSGWQTDDPGQLPRAARLGLGERRRADPAPRLLLHRRGRRATRRARRRPLLHLLPARPGRQFVAIQRRLGASDALDEYIKHVGSAVFAVPPGPAGWLRRRDVAGRTSPYPGTRPCGAHKFPGRAPSSSTP